MPDPAGLLTDEEEERARRWQAGFGGLLSIGAGLMGYGADTRNPAPLMAGISGFQDAMRGAIADRQAAERARYMRAQTDMLTRKAQAEQAFADQVAGALKTGAVPAQGDTGGGGGLDLTEQERAYLNTLPPGKEQIEGFRRIQEARLIARQPPQGYRATPDGKLQAIEGGPADPSVLAKVAEAKRTAEQKAIPATITKGIQENLTAVQKIDQAVAALTEAPDSVGGPGSMAVASGLIPGGETIQNRLDPAGTKARAIIADIGSLKMHDRTGAVVALHEAPRLKPFIPSIADSPETVRTKLANLRNEYANTLQGTLEYYGPDNGFKPYTPAEKAMNQQAQPAPSEGVKVRRYNPQTGRIE